MRTAPIDPERAARLIADIAENLHAAHKKGFVHRDLKPGNILFDRQGRPFISDLGVATSEEQQLAEDGGVVGTLSYMSPEQAMGKSHVVDARADIYSLGVVLYQLLSGRLPFVANDAASYRTQLLERDGPRPLRTIDEKIPAELEAICLKCLRRQASERYTSALDVSHDLRRWLNPAAERVANTIRNRLIGLAVALLTIIAGWAYFAFYPNTDQTSELAQQERNATATDDAQGTSKSGELFLAAGNDPPIWRFDEKKNGYFVASRNPCLVSLGHFTDPSAEISITFEPWNWSSSVGVFVGGKMRGPAGSERPVCQLFNLRKLPRRNDEPEQFRLERSDAVYAEENLSLVSEHAHSWDFPAENLRDLTMRLSYDERGLNSLSIGGVKCPIARISRGNEDFTPAHYCGAWGIFISDGNSWFRNILHKQPNGEKDSAIEATR